MSHWLVFVILKVVLEVLNKIFNKRFYNKNVEWMKYVKNVTGINNVNSDYYISGPKINIS